MKKSSTVFININLIVANGQKAVIVVSVYSYICLQYHVDYDSL